jgi:hypothetical protein
MYFAVLLLSACGEKEKPALGEQAGAVISDTETLREAQAAAGEVIRNAGDCAAVSSGLDAALGAIADAEAEVQTATGRQTLEALRKRVDGVAQACAGVTP